jgi:hypothetical protein
LKTAVFGSFLVALSPDVWGAEDCRETPLKFRIGMRGYARKSVIFMQAIRM